MVEYIFTKIPGVKVFLSNKICHDPVENFFGQQRQRGNTNDNPNSTEFIKNTQALRVINTACSTVRGNYRQTKETKSAKLVSNMAENCEPLVKRPRK